MVKEFMELDMTGWVFFMHNMQAYGDICRQSKERKTGKKKEEKLDKVKCDKL